MPREITHWLILERAAAESTGAVGACVRSHPAYAALGAVAHDAPYYLRAGGDRFEEVAERVHGSHGEDTFDPVRTLARAVPQQPSPLLWAFLLGMVSHIIADATFHPIVYHFTGDYYDLDMQKRNIARTRHRLFETLLDSWIRARLRRSGRLYISETIRELGDGANSIARFLDAAIPGESSSSRPWYRSISTLSRSQSLFLSLPMGILIRGLTRYNPKTFGPIDALFAFRRRKPHPFFEGKISYRNPASGESHSETLEQLLDRAVRETVELFQRFEPLVSGKSKDVDAALGDIRGRSLNSGLVGTTIPDMRHFAQTPFPSLD